jgi:hypothetical protein
MTWLGVASTRTIDDCARALSATDWAVAIPFRDPEDKIAAMIAARFNNFQTPPLLQFTLRFILLTALTIGASVYCSSLRAQSNQYKSTTQLAFSAGER